jgi:hypothetical protein
MSEESLEKQHPVAYVLLGELWPLWVVVGILALFQVWLIAMLFGESISRATTGWHSDIISICGSLLLCAFIVGIILRWWRARSYLSKPLHYLLLGGTGLALSTIPAIVNYSLYLADRTSFRIEDRTLVDEYVSRRRNDLAAEASASLARATWEKSLVERLQTLQRAQFHVKSGWLSRHIMGVYAIDVPIDGVEFEFTLAYSHMPGVLVELWNLYVEEGARRLVINPSTQPGSEKFMRHPDDDNSVQRSDLIALLAFVRSSEMEQYYRLTSQRIDDRIPASAFIYQWAMTVLGDNPKYFKPYRWPTLFVAFLFGVMRYLYAAVFLAVLVDVHRGPS